MTRLSLVAAILLTSPLFGQEPPRGAAGHVRDAAGAPVGGANVFLLETLEGAVSGPDGAFSFATALRGPATLVVRRAGYAELRRPVELPAAAPIEVALEPLLEADRIDVTAGGYAAGDGPGASLTSLEVVTTPGAQADVAGALKALPGVQNVDEGSGLYIRGGDPNETRILLDGAVLLDPLRLDEPTGSVSPTVDPFLLEGIRFSSGGFGARYGDALSAIVDLETQGRARTRHVALGANLAGADASVGLPLTASLGARATAGRWSVAPIFAVNGSTRRYPNAPNGYDASGSVAWEGAAGTLKAFGIRQTTELEVDVAEAGFAGTYALDEESGVVVGTWRGSDAWPIAPRTSLSRSTLGRREERGGDTLATDLALERAVAEAAWAVHPLLIATVGMEHERIEGSFADPAADARVRGHRTGAFAEAETRLLPSLRLTGGLRTDRSTLAARRTFDPRLSASLALGSHATLLLAWGVYHQVADPLLLAHRGGSTGESSSDDDRWPAARARQTVVGLLVGSADGPAFLRLEAYHKRARDLVLPDGDGRPVPGGVGTSRGIDVFLKGSAPGGVRGRIAYSLIDADRTDPDTGRPARSPHDVTHSLTAIAERALAEGWTVRAAYRYATGRPITPVVDATFDEPAGAWRPIHGEPFAERLPAFHRVDLAASHLRTIGPVQIVAYASMTNVLDRENVLEIRWSDDFSERIPVRSRQKRSVFAGVVLEF